MKQQLKVSKVKSGRVAGLVYSGKVSNKPMLVLFNQWRSSAKSILSQYIAELVLEQDAYSCILFIDRIASGGMSDNALSTDEKRAMRLEGEFQFAKIYAAELAKICKKHRLPGKFVVAGSSAGAPAALAVVMGMNADQRKKTLGVVMVEPGGLRSHGFGKKGTAGVAHAFSRHLVAYRHRVQRGWWTPMDKEQYFARGVMFENRANWWARDFVFRELCRVIADSTFPPVRIILSTTSHVHTLKVRESLKSLAVGPHKIVEVLGNHDRICQPPSLSKFYTEA